MLIKTGLISAFLFLYSCSTNIHLNSNESTQTATVKKPNILILHVDDLGYHDLSMNGSEIYKTPNIDALASESVVFQNAYANYPRCVPSRFAMITGSYPIANGDVPDDGFEVKQLAENKNFVQTIQKQGYQTSYFGKWHLGDKNSLKTFGFDFSFAAGKAGSPISYKYPFNVKKRKGKSKKTPIPDVDAYAKPGDYLTDVLTDRLIAHLKTLNKNRPFFSFFSFYSVHQPLEAKTNEVKKKEEFIKNYNFSGRPDYLPEGTGRTKMRQDQAHYAAMVETLDQNIGKVLKTLKELNLEENTIVIFSSDHGGLSNDGTKKRELATSNFPLRAGKGWLYEGGIKIPLLFKWKGKLKPTVKEKDLVMLMDVFPTLVDIVAKKDLKTDGKSLVPIFFNDKEWSERMLFWHSSKARPRNTGDTPCSAIRKGNFKLLHWYKTGRTELYNIANNPSESKNILNENSVIAKKMLYDLNKWKSNFK